MANTEIASLADEPERRATPVAASQLQDAEENDTPRPDSPTSSDAGAAVEANDEIELQVQRIEALCKDPQMVKAYMADFLERAREDPLVASDAHDDDGGDNAARSEDSAADGTPAGVVRVVRGVRKGAHAPLAGRARIYAVESAYYSWSLAQRMAVLGAPSRAHLCKSVVMENTRCAHAEIADRTQSRYYCLITQYVARLNTAKLVNYVRSELGRNKVAKKKFNFRLVKPETALQLTGFGNNAVSPFGMTQPVPIIMAEAITKLDPPVLFLGAGHVDWKLAMPVSDFIAATDCYVADLAFDE